MAAPAHNTNAVSQETPITIKVSVNDSLKKIKLPLKDLGANVLPDKVRPVTQGYTRLAYAIHLLPAPICPFTGAWYYLVPTELTSS